MDSPTVFACELLRAGFVIGMIASIGLYESRRITTGSIVVPGFVGLSMFQPLSILLLAFNSVLTFYVIHRLSPKFLILQNRQKFYACVLFSSLIQATAFFWAEIIPSFNLPWIGIGSGSILGAFAFGGLGYVIPGLIAHDMSRNGIRQSLFSVSLASIVVIGFLILALFIHPNPLVNTDHFEFNAASLVSSSIPLLIAIGSLVAVGLLQNTEFRAGGFIGGAYIVMYFADFIELASLIISTVCTYLFVKHVLIDQAIVFGRRKFAAMLIVGAMMAWTISLIRHATGIGNLSNPIELTFIAMILPGVFANDLQRSGAKRVAIGSLLAVSATLSSVLLIEQFSGNPDLKITALCLLSILFFGFSVFGDRITFSFKQRLPTSNASVTA